MRFAIVSALLSFGAAWLPRQVIAASDEARVFGQTDNSHANNADNSTFDWQTITPDTSLSFHPCYGNLQCARLDVPMDYNRTDGKGSRVALAVVRKPAKVDVTDPRYGGPILQNPGGPGGSGVSLVLRYGNETQTVVDATSDPNSDDSSDDDKYFDIVSWDPRGVGETTPPFFCFPYAKHSILWFQSDATLDWPDPSDLSRTFDTNFVRQRTLAYSCSGRLLDVEEDEDSLVEHINTATVVGDMVSIIEAFGEWREQEAKRILTTSNDDQSQVVLSTTSDIAALERTKWHKGEEKLLYWGFSYGTIVGSTFAAMQPHRVERVIIDGVVDSDDYYGHQLGQTSLIDSESVLSDFFDLCAQAGPEKCAFNTGSSTKEELEADYYAILANLTASPLPVISSDWNGTMFDVVNAKDLRTLLIVSLYNPLAKWVEVAEVLRDLRNGNGTLLSRADVSTVTPAAANDLCPSSSCSQPFAPECRPKAGLLDGAEMAILAADAVNEQPLEGARERMIDSWLYQRKMSPLVGDMWSVLAMPRYGWQAKSKWPVPQPVSGNTSYPLLLIGNTGDPVTPLRSAKKMSTRFPGSVVLTQTSQGHCSLCCPSICTAKVVRAYFQTGVLPKPGTICGVDKIPFLGDVAGDAVSTMSAEDRALRDSLHVLGNGISPLGLSRV